jgi:hypothetical protein
MTRTLRKSRVRRAAGGAFSTSSPVLTRVDTSSGLQPSTLAAQNDSDSRQYKRGRSAGRRTGFRRRLR